MLTNPRSTKAIFRVWPDRSVQCTEEGDACSWKSDDYMLIEADNEDEALEIFNQIMKLQLFIKETS